MNAPSRHRLFSRIDAAVASDRLIAVCVTLVAALVAIPYFLSLDNDFVSDDWVFLYQVVFNPDFPDIWHHAFDLSTNWYFRPVQWIVTWLLYRAFRLRPWGFHLASIIIHGLNILVLALLYRHLLRWRSERPVTVIRCAGLAALVFAVNWHHHESVFWFSAINEPLSGLFQLLSLLLLLQALEGRNHWWLCWGLALIAFTLSLMTKESAAVLPVIAILVVQPVFKRPPKEGPSWHRQTLSRILLVVPFFFVLATWFALSSSHSRPHTYRPDVIAAVGRNWLEFSIAAVRYFLGHYMDAHSLLSWPHPLTLFVGGVLVFFGLAALLRQRYIWIWAFAWVIVGSIPYILFTPFPSDRFLYLTSAPASLLIVETFLWIRRELHLPKLEITRRILSALIASLVGVYILVQISALFSLEADWDKAGAVGQMIIAQVQSTIPEPVAQTTICLDSLPDTVRRKYVFRNGLVQALQIAYGHRGFQVRFTVQPMSEMHPAQELELQGCSHVFRFQDETQQLIIETPP